MKKNKSFRFWFIIFAIQLFAACIVPTSVLLLAPAEDIPVNMEITGVFLEGIDSSEAKNILHSYYRTLIDEGEVILESGGVRKKIPYRSFELQIDTERMFYEIEKGGYDNRFFQLIGQKNKTEDKYEPDVYYNEARLMDFLSKEKGMFLEESSNAELIMQHGALSVLPHRNGQAVNIKKVLAYIHEQFSNHLGKQIIISKATCPSVFEVVDPRIKADNLKDFIHILSSVQGEIEPDYIGEFQEISKKFGDIIIEPGMVFSFKDIVGSFGEDSVRGVLVSSIYRSILPFKEIKVTWRQAAEQPVPGIEAGFEVNLDDEGDLRFENASEQELAFTFHIDHSGCYTVVLAGKSTLNPGEIKTEHTKIAAPVLYTQSTILPEEEQKVIEPGKDGLSVKVYRILQGTSIELYENVYPPVNRMIAIGTKIKKEEIIHK